MARGQGMKITDGERTDFLMNLAEGKTIKAAAELAGISRRAVYYFRAEDPEFAAAMKGAQEQWGENLKSQAEEVLKNRALDPTDRHSHLLLMFLLKKLDHSYKDNYKQEITVKNENTSREFDFSPEDIKRAHDILEDITRNAAEGDSSRKG